MVLIRVKSFALLVTLLNLPKATCEIEFFLKANKRLDSLYNLIQDRISAEELAAYRKLDNRGVCQKRSSQVHMCLLKWPELAGQAACAGGFSLSAESDRNANSAKASKQTPPPRAHRPWWPTKTRTMPTLQQPRGFISRRTQLSAIININLITLSFHLRTSVDHRGTL